MSEKKTTPVRPTEMPHYGKVKNPKSFLEAYNSNKLPNDNIYKTVAGTPFTTVAKVTTKGQHKGEKVIVFKQDGKEMARAYECCWGTQTNCNRTYIDAYTRNI